MDQQVLYKQCVNMILNRHTAPPPKKKHSRKFTHIKVYAKLTSIIWQIHTHIMLTSKVLVHDTQYLRTNSKWFQKNELFFKPNKKIFKVNIKLHFTIITLQKHTLIMLTNFCYTICNTHFKIISKEITVLLNQNKNKGTFNHILKSLICFVMKEMQCCACNLKRSNIKPEK